MQIKNIYWHILSEQYFVQSSQTYVILMNVNMYTPSSFVGDFNIENTHKIGNLVKTHLLIYKWDVYSSIVVT